ncbi:hypothetical protein DFS34DRAFT_647823 [Phlyctochytrium arcticum]|nr:hypothetical protein DFS34DRAFT_647823 [Phlyctochytrium arcticum]
MKVIRISDPTLFDKTVGEVKASATGPIFVNLFGTEDSTTGQSWCPDCVVATPLLRKWIEKCAPDSILLDVPVGERSIWKNNPDNFYRKHPDLQLTAIPTIFKWSKDGSVKKLVEEEAADETKLEAFVS